LLDIIAKNSQQKDSSFRPSPVRKTNTSQSWYTCPPNKTARVTGRMILDTFGASSRVWVSLTNTNDQISKDLINIVGGLDTGLLEFQMNSGDVLGYDQNVGSNASVDGIWRVTELPA